MSEFPLRTVICGDCGERIRYYYEERPPKYMCHECFSRAHVYSRFTERDTDIPKCGIPECGQLARFYIPSAMGQSNYNLSPYYYCQKCYDEAPAYTHKGFQAFDPYEWV